MDGVLTELPRRSAVRRTPSAARSSVEQWHFIKEISSAIKPPQEKPPTKRTAKRVADTMIERKTCEYWMIRIPGRNPNGVIAALEAVRSQYSEDWDDIFKTVTTDNGSEFSMLSRSLRSRFGVTAFRGNSSATVPRMISLRTNWIGSMPVAPDGYSTVNVQLIIAIYDNYYYSLSSVMI